MERSEILDTKSNVESKLFGYSNEILYSLHSKIVFVLAFPFLSIYSNK